MEPNTSCSSGPWTCPAFVEHGAEPSVRARSLLSPSFFAAPSPGLAAASGSRSGPSWYQQNPPSPSPAVAVGDGSLSVLAHATSQSLPASSFFPAADAFPMTGYDYFGNPAATAAATPLPTLHGGQLGQGESSSWSASGVPQSPFQGLSFTESAASEQIAEWQTGDMPSFFPSSSASGLQPQGVDNLVGFAQPSPHSELEDSIDALFRELPDEEEEEFRQVPVVDEEEPLDVGDFLVSDPDDLLPDASWTTGPVVAATGTGPTGSEPSASWMAAGGSSSHNDSPAMLGPVEASTCTMFGTSNGSLPCHSAAGSSMGAGSSIGAMEPSPVQLLTPPSSHGAGASSDFNSFVQQQSPSSVLAPLATCQQEGPLLPVKEKVVMMHMADATPRCATEIISLVDDDDDMDVDDMPCWTPSPVQLPVVDNTSPSSSQRSLLPLGFGLNTLARSSSGHSHEAKFAPAPESRYNAFGFLGSNSSSGQSREANFTPPAAESRYNVFGSRGGGGGSSSSRLGFGSWGSSGQRQGKNFAPATEGGNNVFGTRGGGGGGDSSSRLGFASWGSSSSSSPSFGSWGSSSTSFAGSTLCHNQSTSFDVYGSSSTPKLSIRDKMPYNSGLPPPPPPPPSLSQRAGRRRHGAEVVFTDAETKIIIKEKHLQEVLKTDPKRVKRILYNRAYQANIKARKDMHTKELERQIATLEAKRRSLYEELQSLEEGSAMLRTKQRRMKLLIPELEQQSEVQDVVKDLLNAQIQKLESISLNSLQMR